MSNPDANPSITFDPDCISALAALKRRDFGKCRAAFAKLLRTSPTELEVAVAKVRAEARAAENLPFVEHPPADDPADASALLSEIAALIRRHIIVEPEQADAMALWAAHSHLADIADHSPILLVNAPERECGKSLLQEVLGRLAQKSMFAANMSVAALFRSIEKWQPTLFLDEADTFLGQNADLHGMVNAGYKKGGCVFRTESSGDTFEPRAFPVYCPKSIAGIALERHLPDAMLSRCIAVNMRRKLPEEKVARWRDADQHQLDRLARGMARLAIDLKDQIRAVRPELPEELSDRARDNWEPLLAIAQCAGPEWTARAVAAAIKLSGKAAQPASTGNELLRDIREVLSDWADDRIPTAKLLDRLVREEEMGWATYNRGKPLTPRQLAKQLATYDIKPKTVRQKDGSTPKGYDLRDFDDAFARYLKDDEGAQDGASSAQARTAGVPAGHAPRMPSAAAAQIVDLDEY